MVLSYVFGPVAEEEVAAKEKRRSPRHETAGLLLLKPSKSMISLFIPTG